MALYIKKTNKPKIDKFIQLVEYSSPFLFVFWIIILFLLSTLLPLSGELYSIILIILFLMSIISHIVFTSELLLHLVLTRKVQKYLFRIISFIVIWGIITFNLMNPFVLYQDIIHTETYVGNCHLLHHPRSFHKSVVLSSRNNTELSLSPLIYYSTFERSSIGACIGKYSIEYISGLNIVLSAERLPT
jgi:hypothetical protein